MKLLLALHHPFELWRAPEWFAPRLQSDFPKLAILRAANYEETAKLIADAEIMLGWSLRAEQFAKAKKLKWIHSTAAAVHLLMSPELAASEVMVTNAREVHAPVVAEHAIAVMLALAKKIPSAVRYQEKNIWAQEQIYADGPGEICGATLLLIGLGSIGRELARRAKCLGMRVIAVRQHFERGGGDGVDEVFSAAQMHKILSRADYVVLCAPLTDATNHLVNAEALAAMKPAAFLINVARGPLIDDDALVRALREKRISGAALDVFPEEPLPADSPYWRLQNCLITPHTAAVTSKLWERHYDLFTDNLKRYMKGEPLRGAVDKQLGY